MKTTELTLTHKRFENGDIMLVGPTQYGKFVMYTNKGLTIIRDEKEMKEIYDYGEE